MILCVLRQGKGSQSLTVTALWLDHQLKHQGAALKNEEEVINLQISIG